MVQCSINFENNGRGVFCAGDVMKGTIHVFLHQPKKFQSLSFNVYGASKCSWTESHQGPHVTGEIQRNESDTVHYQGKDVYLNTKKFLLGYDGSETIELPSGTHRYNFAFQLPHLLPASFEATYGSVRYHVEVVLNVTRSFDKKFKLQFTVIRNDDLNHQPELKIPSHNEEIKHFCCLFCKSAPLVMNVKTPYIGYVPGQDIPLQINYINNSSVRVNGTRISLNRITKYNSSTPNQKSKIEVDKLLEITEFGVRKNDSKTIERVLTIPRVLLNSNSTTCNIVQLSYELEFEADVSGCHSNLLLRSPITIGTIPLITDVAIHPSFHGIPLQFSSPSQISSSRPMLILGPQSARTSTSGKTESPPPSFEIAVNMPLAHDASNCQDVKSRLNNFN